MSLPTHDQIAAPPQAFRFKGYDIDGDAGLVKLHYAFDEARHFTETFDYGCPLPALSDSARQALESAVTALFVTAGVSYYKLYAPDRLDLGGLALTGEQLAFFTQLYADGLAEYAHRSGQSLADRMRFENVGLVNSSSALSLDDVADRARSAVLIGGGKDSLVSAEAMLAAGEDFALLAVNPRKPMVDCAAVAGKPLIAIKRSLDPLLFELNQLPGTYNGHVPITAIVSFAAIIGAWFHGYGNVVLSNERSADEPTLVNNAGQAVNHQFSKTSDFEAAMAGYVAANITADISYFSLLRPLSELHIAKLFAKTDRYDHSFTSCNKAFRLANRPDALWCGDCAKCRFTFLLLAAWLPKDRLLSIFPADFLDDPAQIDGYRELMGLAAHKPWDCVGEERESAIALLKAAAKPDWANSAVAHALAPTLGAFAAVAAAMEADLLTPAAADGLPARFADVITRYAS